MLISGADLAAAGTEAEATATGICFPERMALTDLAAVAAAVEPTFLQAHRVRQGAMVATV
jgi:hypothetical protein